MTQPTLEVLIETTPGNYVDVGNYTGQVNITQPFDRNNDSFLTGTLNLTFKDVDGSFNPANPSSTYGPYMVPMTKIIIQATFQSVTYALYTGWAQSFSYRNTSNNEIATMTIDAIDGLGVLAQTTISNVMYYNTTGTTTGYRIYGILLTALYYGAPSMPNLIYVGGSYCQADPGTTRTALQAMQTADNTENGALYCAPNGTLTWLSRDQIYRRSSGTPTTFTDTPGSGITYQDVTFAYDSDFISNYVTVAAPTITPYTVYSPTSIANYFQRNLVRNDVNMNNDYDAYNQALQLLYGRSEPILRISNFTLNANGADATRTAAALAMDYYDPIIVTRHDPDGVAITKNLYCVGFTWRISPGNWTCVVQTAEPDLYGFVLDSPNILAGGILGTNQLTY